MKNKIEKINELNMLLKDGAISKDEFESLKKEIFNNPSNYQEPITNVEKQEALFSTKSNGEKIILKSFYISEGKLLDKPNIEYLNFLDISKREEKLIKPFISSKQINAPNEMTSDEKKILLKLYSPLEIEQLNSERVGFNFPLFSLGSIFCGIFAIFLINISPCMMYLGGISSICTGFMLALIVLTKVSATKSDKTASAIAIILIVFAFVYFGITWKNAMGN